MMDDEQTAGLRERLAEALREHYLSTNRDEADADGNLPCRCGWRGPGPMGTDEDDWDSHLAAALLPVVEAHTAGETGRLGLPARLATALTERFTELGNPYAEMRIHEQGPDGWPSSRAVGPNMVADVLRELLAAGQPPTTPGPGYCPHCGRGDCAPTADDWLRQVERASKAEAAVSRVHAVCTRLAPEQPDPIKRAVAYSEGWNDALDAVQKALYGTEEAR